jgi:hypothetical protein
MSETIKPKVEPENLISVSDLQRKIAEDAKFK